jgi:hypothetical protein
MIPAMEHRDEEVSDVMVILKRECAEGKFDEAVAELKKMAMEIDEADADHGMVQGTIRADKLGVIRKWPCVEYVRVDFTYIADYPPDDPRNLDQPDDSAVDEED